MREWWRRSLAAELTRLRTDWRAAVRWSVRITTAAVASYVVATLLFPGTEPLLAPLTAMLVVQVTPVSLLASGLDRVLAVVAGVSLAVGFAAVVPLAWWSLGLLILLALSIGQVLRLRSNLIEVAISAMLVLGVGALGAEAAAWQRLTETLVGAAVGIAVNLLFPPKVASDDAGGAIQGLAHSLGELLDRAGDGLAEHAAEHRPVAPAAQAWLGEARQITHDMPEVGAALLHAEQGRRLNVRAVGTPDVGPGLRQGLESLEHCAVTIRSMFGALADATEDPEWPNDENTEQVLLGLELTFRDVAAAVEAFGQLVRDQADPGKRLTSADEEPLRDALERLREARARLEDLLTLLSAPVLLQLHGAVLTSVKRILRELDLDERIRRQLRLLPPHRRLPRPGTVGSTNRRATPAQEPPRITARQAQARLPADVPDDTETQVLPTEPRENPPGHRRTGDAASREPDE